MKSLLNEHENHYKRMFDLQEKLRKSEEERIRLEERYNLLLRQSRNRHEACIDKLRIRYLEFLEEQRSRDERNNNLLIALNKIDGSLAFVTAKTERLATLRKQYEAYLLRTYGKARTSGSVTADSGLESQNEQELLNPSPVSAKTLEAQVRVSGRHLSSNVGRGLDYPYYRASTNLYSKFDRPPDESATSAVARYLNGGTSCSEALWLERMRNARVYNFPDAFLYASASVTRETARREEEEIEEKFRSLSFESSGLRDLDHYIGNIRRIQESYSRDSADKEPCDRSQAEAEQNTSGDILNVSLSEEENLLELAPVSKLDSEREELAPKAVEDELNQTTNQQLGLPGERSVYPEQRTSFRETWRLIDRNRRLVSASAEPTGNLRSEEGPAQVERQPEKRSSPEETEEEEEGVEGVEGDGIEDDYDETVDIDAWHPPEEENDGEDSNEELEICQPTRIRRPLESIEEVEQLEEEEDAPIALTSIDKSDVKAKVVEDDLEEEEKEEEEKKQQQSENQLDPTISAQYSDAPVETPEQYQYEKDQPDYAQYQYTDYDNDQYADYTGGLQSYDYQQQNYDYQAEQDSNDHQYPNHSRYQQDSNDQQYQLYQQPYDYGEYDYQQQQPQSTQEPQQSYPESDQTGNVVVDDPEHSSDVQNPEYFEKQSSDRTEKSEERTVPRIDPQLTKKKDAIKSILDSDSESFIERNLSNTESDYDFN